jgi:hypothetical protein
MVAGAALGVSAPAFAAEPAPGITAAQSGTDGSDRADDTDGQTVDPDSPGGTTDPGGDPAGSAESAGTDPAKDDMSAQSQHTIRYRMTNASGVPLTVSYAEKTNGSWRSGQEPKVGDVVNSPTTTDFTNVDSTGLTAMGGTIDYKIGDSGYRLRIKASMPIIGSNSESCSIIDSKGTPVDSSKIGYKCESSHGSGYDMNANFVIEPTQARTQTVTDYTDVTSRDVMEAFCGTSDQAPFTSCGIKPYDVQYEMSDPTPSSKTLVNCTTETASKDVTVEESFGESTSIGTSTETTLCLSDKLSVAVTKSNQHTWDHSRSTSEGTTINVAADKYGYIESQVPMAKVTADYTIKAGNQTFQVNGITLAAPANAAAPTSLRPVDRPRAFDIGTLGYCNDSAGRSVWKEKPVVVAGGGTYTLSLAGANQYRISDPGSTRKANTSLGLEVGTSGYNQDWILSPVPGSQFFQLRNDLTPRQCMDVRGGTDGSDVMLFDCKSSDDPSIANQLWRLDYDPATDSYKIVQPETGKMLTAPNGRASTSISLQSDTGDNNSRWQVNRIR